MNDVLNDQNNSTNKKLFVASLSFKIKDDELKEIFSSVGTVTSAKVIIDRDGRSKGFGFVEMATDDDAKNAIVKLNDSIHHGRNIVVTQQKSK